MKQERRSATTRSSGITGPGEDARYRMLFDHTAEAIFLADTTGDFLLVNNKAVELTGFSRTELLDMNISDLFSGSDAGSLPPDFDLLSGDAARSTECLFTRKDGATILVEILAMVMPDGNIQAVIRDITEKRDAELSMLDTEIKYRNLHMSMMDGYVYVEMNGRIIDSNEAYRRMLGYSVEELSALTYHDLTPAKWNDYEQKIVEEQILLKGHSEVYQKEYKKKDGTVFPVEIRTFLVRNNSGTNLGMWGIVRDITERKQAEEALRQSEEKFRSIVECSPTSMHFYRFNTEGKLIFTGANPAADTTLGVTHALLAGKTILEAFPNLAGTGIPEMYAGVARGEKEPQNFETFYSDERFEGYYSVYVFRTGPAAIAVNFIDITARREMEEALRRSEVEYRDTIDSLPDWIYVVDHRQRIVMVNAMLREELNFQREQFDCVGQQLDTGLPYITDDTLEDIREVFSTGILSVRQEKIGMDNKILHLEATHVPIFKDGTVVKVVLMIRDRSKEKEVEDVKLRAAEQKEVLLREIHHRVKNNLAIVISLLNFQLRNNSNEVLNRMILDIQMRIRSMALIHEHLYRSENLDRIPLASYIDSLAGMIMTAFRWPRIRFEKKLDPLDVSIEIALPVGLIINELLTNAFKYAFPDNRDGEIRVRLENETGHQCLLVVEDNGIGLPNEPDPASDKSVGLYIVHLLVEQIEGTIEIVRNQGTSFRIRFINLIQRKKDKLQG